MSDDNATKIAELAAYLRQEGLPAVVREAVEQQLRALQAAQSAAPAIDSPHADRDINIATHQTVSTPTGTVANQGSMHGNAIGVNYGTVQAFFGGAPGEKGEQLLADYLVALEQDCQRLHLARLTGRRQTGADQRATPPLRLQAVYTSLTTDGPMREVYRPRQRIDAWMYKLINRSKLRDYSLDAVSPERARVLQIRMHGTTREALDFDMLPVRTQTDRILPHTTAPDALLTLRVFRPELATEAIRDQRRLVLLGEPGHGKSTVLRYLALLLARRLRGASVDLPEWPTDALPVPILLPLGQVAAAMSRHGDDARVALWQVLGDVLEGPEGLRAGLRDHLKPAVRAGAVLLCCDGLDELPAEGAGGGVRAQVAAALRSLASSVQARMVVTSRVLPYRAASDWQLPAEEGWQERTIQPLAFGQVRVFVDSWYRALSDTTPELVPADAEARAGSLIAELAQNERLRPLVQSPLLLTMLAILHANSRDGEIPRERVRLYDECVQLLLERWEPVRTPGLQRPGLIERLGNLPGLEIDKLRDVIHELAFQAHDQPPGDDGRGRIDRHRLSGRLLEFFNLLGSADPARNIRTFLEIIRAEAGLLVTRDDESAYTFPHLTFQEFLAACWLADQKDMERLAYARWQGDDRERWRTMLLLLVGRLRQKGQKDVERDGVPWLQTLTGTTVHGRPKPPNQRRYDAALAVLSYAELGGRAALATSMRDLVPAVEGPLRDAIVELLETPDPAISTADRIAAARVLADLGDPRFPITLDDWQRTLTQRNQDFGRPTGYWCYVRPGSYRIGGWEEGQPAVELDLPAFWIARFPISVGQYAPFVGAGYGPDSERWWTPEGWRWKQGERRTEPRLWKQAPYDGSNQPVIGVTWYEATAFCAWLTDQLAEALPEGYVARLPTEAEWETAAAYDAGMQRRTYPWGEEEPTPERAIYNASNLGHPAPVECCPAGAAACGAQDLAGNVWEWTTSSHRGYPAGSNEVIKDFTNNQIDVPLRGGDWTDNSTSVRCGARGGGRPVYDFDVLGFRVLVAPRSH